MPRLFRISDRQSRQSPQASFVRFLDPKHDGRTTHEPPEVDTKPSVNITRQLMSPRPLTERLEVVFREARKLLESTSVRVDAISRFAHGTGLDDEAMQRVIRRVLDIDHLGILVPPGVDTDVILALAARAGFNQRVMKFPSTIVARELGEKCGREVVPTMLLKAFCSLSDGRAAGVELFLPDAEPSIVKRWISEGAENHVALRVRTRESIHAIHEELRAVGYPLPDFMQGRPMENPKDNVLLLYVDLPDGRMEFYYDEAEPQSEFPEDGAPGKSIPRGRIP